jgi:hypothetical protein
MAHSAQNVRLPPAGKPEGKKVLRRLDPPALAEGWKLGLDFPRKPRYVQRREGLGTRKSRRLPVALDSTLLSFPEFGFRQVLEESLEGPAVPRGPLGDLGIRGEKARNST